MTDPKNEQLEKVIESLKQGRDELKVQLHLAKAEAKELWQETEDKWQHLRDQLDKIDSETGDTAKNIGAATMVIADEIKHGYEKLKKLL